MSEEEVVGRWGRTLLGSSQKVKIIRRDCGVMEPHPSLSRYVPGVPSMWRECIVDAGITGESIGRPEWGYVASIDYVYSPEGRMGYISDVYVWEEFRRRGFGTQLMKFAIDEMRRKGVETVYFAPVTPLTLKLAELAGFERLRDTPLYYMKLK